MRTALDVLAEKVPKESGGSRANNRLGYQKDWTFCLLLKLHLKDDDYLVVCDYHDDVLVMDDSNAPDRIHFYQVKTNATKGWTISDLIYQENGKNSKLPSMLGKLYSHRLEFDGVTGTLNFVANLPINVNLQSKPSVAERLSFTTEDLDAKQLKRIEEALRKELSLDTDPILDTKIIFHLDDINVRDHETFTIGQLAKYLETRDPTHGYPSHAIYKAIYCEIDRRVNLERPCTSVVEIQTLKGISRNDFEGFLINCIYDAQRRNYNAVVEEFRECLQNEDIKFGRRRELNKRMDTFAIERLDGSRCDLLDCAKRATEFAAQRLPGSSDTLLQLMNDGATFLETYGWGSNFAKDELMVIIAWEILTYEGNLQTTNQQSTEKYS